jgi:hypothetical protein
LDGLDDLEYADFERNICINEIAENQTEIEQLKKNLRENCTKVPDWMTTITIKT